MADKVLRHRAMFRLRQGDLHKALGVKDGEDIDDNKLDAASKSTNEHVKMMAMLHKMHKGSKKS